VNLSMKHLTLFLCLYPLAGFGQTATPATPKADAPKFEPKQIPGDTVVLKVGAKPLTAAQFETLLASFPPDIQKAARSNPKQVVQSYFLMEKLMHQAEEEKLDQSSPLKEQLKLQRMQLLAQTVVNHQLEGIAVSQADQLSQYEADKDKKYAQAKIRGIMIQFADPKAVNAQVDMSNGANPKATLPLGLRSEAEAKGIADDVIKQLREGADFEKLAKEKSDDKTTAPKGGDFGIMRQAANGPADIKKAVFALKQGEVSDPIRQAVAYYIVKVDERTTQPFSEVQKVVAAEVKQERFQKWMADEQKQFEVSVELPGFFGAPALPMPQTSPSTTTSK
jgi:peptidyl-prolyl cis-trans isomerase C